MVAVGDRIRLDEMPNDPDPIPVGSLGTVESVLPSTSLTPRGQIGVNWDNGRALMLVPPADRFTVIGFSVLALRVGRTPKLVTIEGDSAAQLDRFQSLVGGYIEGVGLEDGVTMYCNEEGKLQGQPFNRLATMVAERFHPGFSRHDVIVGDTVVVGVDSEGDSVSVPERVTELVTQMWASYAQEV